MLLILQLMAQALATVLGKNMVPSWTESIHMKDLNRQFLAALSIFRFHKC